MTPLSAIIVDDDDNTAVPLADDLRAINVNTLRATDNEDAWLQLRLDSSIGLAVIRFESPRINGIELCRQIREVKDARQLPVVILLPESQLEHGHGALEAGANDVLIAPFVAAELLLRAGFEGRERRRIDAVHSTAKPGVIPAAEKNGTRIVMPTFNRDRLQFTYSADERQLKAWDADDCVEQSLLDVVMVCPECESLPSFRYGCVECGSAMMKRERLIHHYKCAHVAPESEFRHGSDLVCPKCRLIDLVAGVDFEHVFGSYSCSDCGVVASDMELIGHCLNCELRFAAADAHLKKLVAYTVRQPAAEASAPTVGVQKSPHFQRQKSRPMSPETV